MKNSPNVLLSQKCHKEFSSIVHRLETAELKLLIIYSDMDMRGNWLLDNEILLFYRYK